jgi:predicted esterase
MSDAKPRGRCVAARSAWLLATSGLATFELVVMLVACSSHSGGTGANAGGAAGAVTSATGGVSSSTGGSVTSPSAGGSTVTGGAPGSGTGGAPANGGASSAGAAGSVGSGGVAMNTGGAAGSGGAAAGAGGSPMGGSTSGGGTGGATAPAMKPIDPPVADDCIKDVSPGDHAFTCSGLTFLTMVDPMCTKYACGVIFDIHGATMSGAQMRDNTLLYKIAPSKGYIVVNPSATASNTGGTWDLTNDPPKVADFLTRTIKAYHVDPDRVHVGGFSQGSIMTFWLLCNHHDIIASAAPVSGATDVTCITDASFKPRVPIFYENGINDRASMIDSARTMVDDLVKQLSLMGGMQIAGDGHYTRKHWTGDGGMEFDYIEHDYGGQAVLDGHCIPGGVDKPGTGTNNFSLNATTCTTGMIAINWGELALEWYIGHPRVR